MLALRPVEGDQEYVDAPEAVKLTEEPAQIEGVLGETLTTGIGFTVTVTVVLATHPAAEVPVTV